MRLANARDNYPKASDAIESCGIEIDLAIRSRQIVPVQ
jgi:hypothetical protein